MWFRCHYLHPPFKEQNLLIELVSCNPCNVKQLAWNYFVVLAVKVS